MTAEHILNELHSVADTKKARFLQGFFKTGPGEYAEGDLFLGIVTPLIRSIAKVNIKTPLHELQTLITSEYHEARLCALLIAAARFKKAAEEERTLLFEFYLRNTRYANNWDLVDVAYPHVVGVYLLDKERSILYELAQSTSLWEQRIAIVSTVIFIRNNEFIDTLALSEQLLSHPHDLIHKAVGWMLREVGKRDRETLTDFIERNSAKMSRTTLRYAIEHYPEDERQYFLRKDKKQRGSANKPGTS
ncbi:MAG: DNA alkylation repair protein [Tannerellaceae bacterium]|jgi:3-methyladenine DNA glycosylase AlkD|nr:DNA alkylation repair protein [Tannerellaceae bacterium]